MLLERLRLQLLQQIVLVQGLVASATQGAEDLQNLPLVLAGLPVQDELVLRLQRGAAQGGGLQQLL
jgi:hypothetical protein